MGDQDDIVRLMRWSAEGRIPQKSYDRLQAHPLFAQAARALSTGMLAAAREDKALDGIAKDVGRYVAAQWAVYLHVSGGLTLPRLKEICTASGLMSPGRARAVLLFLRYLGYVEPVAKRIPGEPARYAPTASLLRAWKRLVRHGLEAACLIEPAATNVLARLDDMDFLEHFLRHQGGGMLVAASAVERETPFIRVFLHRHAGMQTVHWMLLSAEKGDAFPPRRPISVPIASVARQLRVSRTHVDRLLNEAEREGLVRRDAESMIEFTEMMQSDILFFISSMLIGLLICAAKSARDVAALRALSPSPTIGAAARRSEQVAGS